MTSRIIYTFKKFEKQPTEIMNTTRTCMCIYQRSPPPPFAIIINYMSSTIFFSFVSLFGGGHQECVWEGLLLLLFFSKVYIIYTSIYDKLNMELYETISLKVPNSYINY